MPPVALWWIGDAVFTWEIAASSPLRIPIVGRHAEPQFAVARSSRSVTDSSIAGIHIFSQTAQSDHLMELAAAPSYREQSAVKRFS